MFYKKLFLNFFTFFLFFAATYLVAVGKCTAKSQLAWQNDKVKIDIYVQPASSEQQQNFSVLVAFELLDGWHISWENPGDAGIPTEFSWNLPNKWQVENINSSTPQKFLYEDIITQYGYGHKAYYLFNLTPSDNETISNAKLLINWVACKDSCEPESAVFDIPLERSSNSKNNGIWQQAYSAALNTFPTVFRGNARKDYESGLLKISLEPENFELSPSISPIYFIPKQIGIIAADSEQSVNVLGNVLEIRVEQENPEPQLQEGILIYGDKAYTIKFFEKRLPKPINTHATFWLYIFAAFAAGIILNFMPCVFPILSLKALMLAKSGVDSKNYKHGFMYLCGVLCSFSIMAGVLFVLRQGGESAGWGFQLQSPWFVAVMLAIFIFILLMLLDLIKIRGRLLTIFNRLSAINPFFTGFFAVLIASPCTGPFMGAAIGYALMQPAQYYFPIFFSLGLGYAIPFMLIEIFPGYVKKLLPKPGNWMKSVKYVLSIPILLTCIWLGWVLYHELQPENNRATVWEKYNPQKISDLLAQGRPVFIEFTAKWCLTCLMNEKTTLHTPGFSQLAYSRNIALFRADWTSQDSQISQALSVYGRNSVPLYIFYPGGQNDYIILPQILSPGLLENSLNTKNKYNNRSHH